MYRTTFFSKGMIVPPELTKTTLESFVSLSWQIKSWILALMSFKFFGGGFSSKKASAFAISTKECLIFLIKSSLSHKRRVLLESNANLREKDKIHYQLLECMIANSTRKILRHDFKYFWKRITYLLLILNQSIELGFLKRTS